jgi:predicted metal-dependent peptidase
MATDFLVNHLLIKEQIGAIPKSALYDPRYSSDIYTVEELYTLLEHNQTAIRLPLDMHLDADGDGSEGQPSYTEVEQQSIRDTMRAALIQGVQQQEAKTAGSTPLGILRLVDQFLRPRIDWRTMLDHVLRSALKYDYSYARLSRRFWSSGLVLPGQDVMERVEAVACLDGSASTTTAMITDFLTECYGIMTTFRDFQLLVMTFDTEVYNIQEFTPDNADEIMRYDFHGGGGTAPSCCWRYLQDNEIIPDKLLIFTDGQVGNDWGQDNYCDTLFIIHSNPHIDAPHSATVHYDPKR